MKISSIPKSGRENSVVYVNTRHGKIVREYVCPRNPRTADQQGNRSSFGAVSKRWRTLVLEQRAEIDEAIQRINSAFAKG